MESAKIQEAIVHACGQLRLEGDDHDEDDAYGYDGEDDYVAEAGHSEAQRALQDWAELISNQQFPPMAPIFYVTMMSEQSADDLTSI